MRFTKLSMTNEMEIEKHSNTRMHRVRRLCHNYFNKKTLLQYDQREWVDWFFSHNKLVPL